MKGLKNPITRYPYLIAGGYLLAAAAYILLTDWIAFQLFPDPGRLSNAQLVKGLGFVLVTSIALFALLKLLFGRIGESTEELLRSREVLIASERRSIAGVLSASVAHDCSNVLTILGGEMRQIRLNAMSPDAVDAHASRAIEAVHRLEDLARQFRRTARMQNHSDKKIVSLCELLEDGIHLLRQHYRIRGCQIRWAGFCPIVVEVYPVLIHQILANLLLNAADATDGKGIILIQVHEGEHGARLEVHDDGPGVPNELRDRIFDPFFSTKEEGDGEGLGLVSVRACVEAHGGTVEVANSHLGGACFRIHLPRRIPMEGRLSIVKPPSISGTYG